MHLFCSIIIIVLDRIKCIINTFDRFVYCKHIANVKIDV